MAAVSGAEIVTYFWCHNNRPKFQRTEFCHGVNPYHVGEGVGGQVDSCDVKIGEQFLCSHNNKTALIKQLYLFDIVLIMTNT